MWDDFNFCISDGDAIITSLKSDHLYDLVDDSGIITHRNCLCIPRVMHGHTVTKIDDYAFSPYLYDSINSTGEDTNIVKIQTAETKIETIILPDSIISIGANAFSGCINLKNIYIPGNQLSQIGSADWSNRRFHIDFEKCPFRDIKHPTVYCNKDNFAIQTYCSASQILYQNTLQNSRRFHTEEYLSQCKKRFRDYAIGKKLALIEIDNNNFHYEIFLGDRPFKAFQKNVNIEQPQIGMRVFALAQVVWFEIKIDTYDVIIAPYNPYVNGHLRYSSGKFDSFSISLYRKGASTCDYKWEIDIGWMESILRAKTEDLLGRPFIGIEGYINLIEQIKDTGLDNLEPENEIDWEEHKL